MRIVVRKSTIAATAVALAMLASAGSARAFTVWAVGDGANSGSTDDAVAAMIEAQEPDAFIYLGDVYGSGTASQYSDYYAPGYGQMKSITLPTPGNHEWDNRATGYDAYWPSEFTSPHYFSRDLDGWHLISLNSEEAKGSAGSAQLAWLQSDLAANTGRCTIAFAHKPRYSAGGHGDQDEMEPLWNALAGKAAVGLFGHDHLYQRLKPIDGINSFSVGTGGAGLYSIDPTDPRLAAWNNTDHGALRLTLYGDRADFTMFALSGAVIDSGSISCDGQVSGGGGGAGGGEPGSLPGGQQSPGSPLPAADDSIAPKLLITLPRRRTLRVRRGKRIAIRYRLSEDSTVSLRLARRKRGRYVTLDSRNATRSAGKHRTAIPRRLNGRRLRPGGYRLRLFATDGAGNRSPARSVKFRISR